MVRYSEEIIEEVRSRNDIVDVISSYVSLKKRGTQYFGLCPFHNEKTPSFSVTPSKQMFYCFGCHEGGSVFTFLQKMDNLTFVEALQVLADRAGIALPQEEMSAEDRARQSRRTRLYEIQREAAKFFYATMKSEEGKRAYDYFKDRGLSDETITGFGLGYAGNKSNRLYKYLRSKGYEDDILKDSGLVGFDEVRGGFDRFWNRAMFPIIDDKKRVIAFGGRVMGEGEPKYLNSPETPIFEKSYTLFGINLARKSKRGYLILCEGYMDVISLHQAGFDCAIASLGTALTPGHAGRIARFSKDVYLSYDSDGAGVNAAVRAIPILRRAGITPKVVKLSPYKDPDELIKACGAEEYEKRIEEAENAFSFTMGAMEANYNLTDPEEKTRFLTEVADMILEFPEEVTRSGYAQMAAERYGVRYEAMSELVTHRAASPQVQKKLEEKNRDPKSGDSRETAAASVRGRVTEAADRSQKLLLTWIVDNPEIYGIIKGTVSPDDFDEGVMRTVAQDIFAGLEAGDLVPGRIVDSFMEPEDQREVSEILFTTIGDLTSPRDKNKALRELVARVKKDSFRREKEKRSDAEVLSLVLEEKQVIKKIEKLVFYQEG